MLISKGPRDWHSGQEPGFTSWFCDWKKGPRMKLHLLQLYLTMPSWGRTPVQLVTTPLVRISWFRWSCLQTKEICMVLRHKAWRPFFYFLSNLFTESVNREDHTITNTFCPLIKKFCSMNIPIRWDLTQNTFAYSKSDFLPRFSPSYFITECSHRDTSDQSVHSKGFKPFRMTWSK